MPGSDGRRQDFVPIVLGLLLVSFLQASTYGQSAARSAGRTATTDPYMGGMAPAPPGYTYATQGSAAPQSSAAMNRNMMDPMGFGYAYGPGIPMTSTQAG